MRYKWFKGHKEVYEELLEAEEESKKSRRVYEKEENVDPVSPQGIRKRIFARRRIFSSVAALIILLYGIFTADVPIAYVGLAFLMFEGRVFASLLPPPKDEFASRIMYILSIFLFVGAFVIAFV